MKLENADTSTRPREGFARPWPDEIPMDEKTKALVDKKWKDLGIE